MNTRALAVIRIKKHPKIFSIGFWYLMHIYNMKVTSQRDTFDYVYGTYVKLTSDSLTDTMQFTKCINAKYHNMESTIRILRPL